MRLIRARTVPAMMLCAVLAGCDRVAPGEDRRPDAPPEIGAEDQVERPVLTAPPPGRETELREAPDRPWLTAGSEIELNGLRYRADDVTMTFHEDDLVEFATHDGVALHRPIWSDADAPDFIFVRLSDWLWRPFQHVR